MTIPPVADASDARRDALRREVRTFLIPAVLIDP